MKLRNESRQTLKKAAYRKVRAFPRVMSSASQIGPSLGDDGTVM